MPALRRGPAAVPRGGLRAAAFASCAVLVSLAAHVLAGGRAPDVTVLLAAPVVVQVIHRAVAWRPWGRAGTAAALLVAQVGLHLAFQLPSANPAGPAGHAGGAMGGTGTDCMAAMTAMAGTGPGTPVAHHAVGPAAAAWMVLAHLACAVLLGVLLSRGDDAVLVLTGLSTAAVEDVGPRVRARAAALLRVAALLTAVRLPTGDDRERPATCPGYGSWRPARRVLTRGGRFWRGPPAIGLPLSPAPAH